jgi:hypothetical protein
MGRLICGVLKVGGIEDKGNLDGDVARALLSLLGGGKEIR